MRSPGLETVKRLRHDVITNFDLTRRLKLEFHGVISEINVCEYEGCLNRTTYEQPSLGTTKHLRT